VRFRSLAQTDRTGGTLVSFFFSSRRRHTRFSRDWSSDVCSSDLAGGQLGELRRQAGEDLSDAEKPCGRGALAGGTSRRHQSFARSIGEAKKFIRNLPMRSSEPFFSSLRSTRSPST